MQICNNESLKVAAAYSLACSAPDCIIWTEKLTVADIRPGLYFLKYFDEVVKSL